MGVTRICGFETDMDAVVIGGTYDTDYYHSGLRSVKLDSASYAYISWSASSGTPFRSCSLYLRIFSLPSVDGICQVVQGGVSNSIPARLVLQADGKLALYYGATLRAESVNTLSVDGDWHRIEFSVGYLIGYQQGMKAWVDGAEWVYDNTDSYFSGASQGMIGNSTGSATYNINIDDVIWEDQQLADAPVADDWKTILLLPFVDETKSSWTGGGGGLTNLWNGIDNIPPQGVLDGGAGNITQIRQASTGANQRYRAFIESAGGYQKGIKEGVGIKFGGSYAGPSNTIEALGMQFMLGMDATIESVRLVAGGDGVNPPNTNATVEIQSDNNGEPSGTVIGSFGSLTKYASRSEQILTGSADVTQNTYYWLVINFGIPRFSDWYFDITQTSTGYVPFTHKSKQSNSWAFTGYPLIFSVNITDGITPLNAQVIAIHGEGASTGIKTGYLYQPYITTQLTNWTDFEYGDNLGACGTYTEGWAIAYSPVVDVTGPEMFVATIEKVASTARAVDVCFMGVYFSYLVQPSGPSSWNEQNRDLTVTATITETDVATLISTNRDISITATITETDGKLYTETNHDISVAATITETDVPIYVETNKDVSCTSTISETNALTRGELNRDLSVIATVTRTDVGAFVETLTASCTTTITEVDGRILHELNKDVSVAATITETDAKTTIETNKDLSIIASVTEVDTTIFVETLSLTTTATITETDGLTLHELNLDLSVTSTVTEEDTYIPGGQSYVETNLDLSCTSTFSETDISVFVDTRDVYISATITEIHTVSWSEIVSVTCTATITETDISSYVETLDLTSAVTVTDVDALIRGELNRDIQVNATITETDGLILYETLDISASSLVTETDLASFVETDDLSLTATLSETDLKILYETNLDLSVVATITETDIYQQGAQTYYELDRDLSCTSTVTGSDSLIFTETLYISVASTFTETDIVTFIDNLETSCTATITEVNQRINLETNLDLFFVSGITETDIHQNVETLDLSCLISFTTVELQLQSIVPDFDLLVTGWTDESNGTTDLWSHIDETVLNLSDYVKATIP